jgi:hypothetical protein
MCRVAANAGTPTIAARAPRAQGAVRADLRGGGERHPLLGFRDVWQVEVLDGVPELPQCQAQ